MAINRNKVLDSAQKLLAKGNFDKAIFEFKKLVEDDPSDVRTLLKIGDIYTRKGDRREACDTYRSVAERYAEEGFYLKAVAVHKQILKLDPTRVDIQLELAQMYEELQLKNDALAAYEAVARAYAREGDIKTTLRLLRKMGKIDPENIPIRIKYAEALSQAGKKEEAADAFGVGAALLKQQGRMDDYVKVAERMLYHRPSDAPVARELASLYLQKKDPKRALTKLQLCFKTDPRNVPTLELLARAFEMLGQTQKTISVYREMARILHETNEPEQRATVLNRILELDPNDKEARQALAAYAPSLRGSIAPSAPPPVGPPSAPPPPGISAAPPGISAPPPASAPGLPPVASDPPLVSAPPPSATSLDPVSAPPSSMEPPAVRTKEEEIEELESHELELVDDDDDVMMLDDDELEEESSEPQLSVRPANDDEMNDPSFRPVAGMSGSAGRASIPDDVAQKAQIARLLTECEVFERYGLRPKVIEQLNRVLLIDSRHVEARERLKEAFLGEGMLREGVEQLRALEEIVRDERPGDAERYAQEAEQLAAQIPPEPVAPAAPAQYPPADQFMDMATGNIPAQPPMPGAHGQPYHDTALQPIPPAHDPNEPAAPADLLEQPFSPAEFEAGPLRATSPGEESAARERGLMPATPVEEALDEAEFFLQQGLLEEARIALSDALESFPAHMLLREKLEEVANAAADAISEPPPSAPAEIDQDDSFLLAEKLAEELDEVAESEDIGSDVIDVETVFEQFKKGVQEVVSDDDTETHYDLGIAYMEMGLLDDAVNEFDLARMNPQKECTAYTMMGLCYERKGDFQTAIAHFKKGLYAEARTDMEELALYFELGNAYQEIKDDKEALYYYEKVEKRDSDYRGVKARIDSIKNPGAAVPGPSVPEQDEIDAAFDDLISD